ncbi:MAG: hypothetical protein AAB531_05260 [Patescibacteria group bacterium]
MDDQTPQPINPPVENPTPQTVIPPVSKSFLSTKIILLIVIFLILIAGGGTYFALNSKTKPTPPVSKATKTSVPIPTPDPTASWKTYINAKGKYSLQYPPTTAFIEDASGNATGNLSNNKVVIATEPTVLSLNNYIDQKTWCLSISSTTGKAFNLNSDNSLRFDKTPCGSTGSTDIYSVHNGIAYHIFIETQENFDKVQPIFDQILSTFKFTDASQTTDASTWKTYTSPNKIFTLKYPLSLNVTQKYISNLPSGWLDEGVLSTTQPWNDSFTKNSDYRINFSQVPKSSGESLENFVSRFIKERGGSFLIPDSKKTIRVDGKESIWYVGNLGPATKHIEVYIPKTNTEVLIVELWDNNQPPSVDHQNILDQILSTFKFTQ